MKRNTSNTLAVACSLSLVVSMLAGNAWARGSGGGHTSGGSSRRSSGMTRTSSNFARTMPMSGVNHDNNNFNSFKPNTTNRFQKSGNFKNGFDGKNHFQKLAKKFPKSKGGYWNQYCNWGKSCGPWGCGFGWGWGCWDSPWCYGWSWYEPIPAVAYYNPYCDCAGNVVDGIDYSVPIASANVADTNDSDAFAAAREAFAQGNWDAALQAISVALLQTPHNQDVHQFHSLVLFATNSYCKSATVAHAVLEEGPGWSWDTLQTFYSSPDVYTEQLRRLEHFVSEHPSDANVRFLLGYHYMLLNHAESAQRQLAQVVELEPKDKLAANILAGIKSEAPTTSAPDKTAPTNTVPTNTVPTKIAPTKIATVQTALAKTATVETASKKVEPLKAETVNRETAKVPTATTANDTTATDVDEDPSDVEPTPVVNEELVAQANVPTSPNTSLTGTWKATPVKGVQIELTLRDDQTFNWKFAANGKTQNFTGKYELGIKSLVLTRGDGDAMHGTLDRGGDTSFKFRMTDADAEDPGLSFSR
jgi:tetratricopeptide (TPR) repeat protein